MTTTLQNKFADLSPARKAALFDQLRKKRQASEAPQRIERRGSGEPPLLSFGQLRLWFLDRLSPGDPTYNLTTAVEIHGTLHVPSLLHALAGVADRHEALRTTFAVLDGTEPVQVIAPRFVPRLPVVDLEALPAERRDAELRHRTAAASLPFDLERGPLLRAHLFRVAGGRHLLLLVMHHSVSDGWSMGVLVQEVAALYTAFVAGRPSPLPELPLQYADFAVWERHMLSGERLAHLVDVWRRRLAGAPPAIHLPADRPRPAVKTSAGAGIGLTFPPRATARLTALARQVHGTFFMALLAAWNVLLHRYTGATDLVVGTPVANRRSDTADLIGFFVNTLALRCDLAGDPTFEELVLRVREVTLEAFAHQTLPFEKLVEELRPERDPSRTPLFQVMCTLQAPAEPLELEDLRLENVDSGAWSAKFDLSLTAGGYGEELGGSLTYWTALFDAATIERLGSHFTALIAATLESPGQRISQLPILRREEIAELTGWATPALPGGGLVHERIAAWADRDPERPALRGEDGDITYGELRRRASELASRLRALGVGPEVRVAVTGTREASTVVGIVAVLEAGGAYVPLDPALPEARREALLEEAGCGIWLHRTDVTDRTDRTGRTNPVRPVLPENTAYVLFTSGSTGTPKGVAVEHRQLSGYVDGAIAVLGLPSGARYALVSTFAADLGHTSLFPALVTGGCLDVVPEAAVLDPEAFARHLEHHPADCLKIVPSHLAALLGSSRPALPRQRLILGGEATSIDLARRLRELAPDLAVFNHYGPTETTVGAIAGSLAFHEDRQPYPLGRPLPGVHIRLLGTMGELVPPGVVGEIHIGGSGVARGYLGRPGLTAERFVPDPFSPTPGGRLYRTGDLARLTAEGLVWLGRADHQVKIRGFRVEPGEVEAALARQPGVSEAVVLVHEDAGDRRLVGYVVPQTGADLSPADLRSALRRSLPEAMVPSDVVVLESLPLTANGKVDRRALARIVPLAVRDEARFTPPQGPAQEKLAAIWAEVLGAARLGPEGRVGAHDDFFALGGHSLLATRVISRIRETFGVEMPLRSFFEAPTVAELAAQIEREEIGPIGQIRPIGPASETAHQDGLPLSFAQQRLWLIDQLDPGNPAYNVPQAVRLTGELSIEALERTFAEIVRRHAVLRTRFLAQEGEPVQVIARPEDSHPALQILDLTNLPPEMREARALQLALEEARAPFDLQRGPVLRLRLLRLDEREHVLVVTLHHIVSDAWSREVLLREIGALYPAFLGGEPSPLPELALQYADFARWQREELQGGVLEKQLTWWRDRLAGAPHLLELPTDRPRPALQTFDGTTRMTRLSPALSEAVRELGRREGATSFMIFLAAWAVLLGRHADQDDVLLGTPVAGRNRKEIEELIGFFVNTLVLRIRTTPPSFRELLAHVRETALDAFSHQDVPFERLVEDLVPERDLSHTPLFQATFSLENATARAFSVPGLSVEQVGLDRGTAKFDLALILTEWTSTFSGVLEHSTALFDGSTVERLAERFEVLLEAIVQEPGQSPMALPLLGPAERHQTLVEWNDRETPCPQQPMLHELFSLQARRHPEALAVQSHQKAAEGHLTYGELETLSNRLAWHLRRLGVGPDVPVALCTGRTSARAVGAVAVLKAGGAYVALDPAYPRDRLAFLLEDSRAPVVLTQGLFLAALPETTAQVIDLDADWEQIRGADDRPPVTGVGPDNLAYVVYTSGSTGTPKGVELAHAGLMSLVRWHLDLLRVTPEDRAAQTASPAFDSSVWELWPYLVAGASVHIPDEDTRLSASGILRWWSEQGITLSYLTTPLAEGVLEEKIPEVLRGTLRLRTLLTGGDRLHRRPDPEVPFRLMNTYGPAETTVTSTGAETAPQGDAPGAPSIGRPIDNTQVYVLDRQLEPVPIGVPGELFIAGIGVARGYLRRPELTAERFLPDPWSAGPGARMYRTGDRVRTLPDGEIDFFGRMDLQFKIRGIRIEPGEIEAALTGQPGVREAAVLVHEDSPGDRRLVAFIVPRDAGTVPDAADLRNALLRTLPDALVPADYVILESLPLTANGKVDRRALAGLAGTAHREERPFTPPQGPVEEKLAGIWAEVLGSGRLGPEGRLGAHDDFFALGGHSLLATRVVARIRTAFGIELPLRALFESPTIAGLAARLEREDISPISPIGPIRRISQNRADLPLSFAQQRLWFLDRLAPGNPFYNMYNALRLTGALDVTALQRAFQEIVRRQEGLRTTFPEIDGQPRQVIAPVPELQLPLVDLDGLPEESGRAELTRLSLDEARRPFDLARGPLFRATLVRERGSEHTLLVSLHHVISDGWSMGILSAEIAALYGAFAQNAPSPLPELPIQYADFAVWQREHLQGERLEAELDYWRHQLAGIPETLELPSDHPRPAVDAFRGATEIFTLPVPLVRALSDLTRRHGATRSMTMLAGYQALLGRYAGQDDVAVGMAIANRTRREVEGLIGFFVNSLVLRTDLSGAPGFGTLVEQVRETALAAYAHQDLPFERLVEELQPERALNRNPLVQVMFGYQNFPRTRTEVQELVLSTPEESAMATGTAKFDLTLFLFEDGDWLQGALEYNNEIFDEATIRRLIAGFERLLTAAVASPEVPVDRLPLLGPAESQTLLVDWNETGTDWPAAAGLQELFAEQVREAPDAPAVVFGDQTLTYAELDRQARRLAQRLRRLGAGPESRIGLCADRSLEMVAGFLGIIQAGAAYVPLDPDYPADRLAFLVEDAGVRWIVGDESSIGLLPQDLLARQQIVRLREGGGAPLPEEGGAMGEGSGVRSHDGHALAHIIYTSGSTGRPKGVAIPHRGIVRLVRSTNYLQLGPGDRVAQVANLNFDAATWEIWGALLNGAALVVIPRDVALSSVDLVETLRRHQTTSLLLTTAWLNKVAREIPDAFRDLRDLLFGGEAADPAAVRAVLDAGPPRRIIHLYGPAESTMCASWHPVEDVPPGAVTIPIGTPVANTSIYVLDRWQSPVPQGALGELCIGGDGLARGYWQRPELTAERFLPNPWSPGDRLYRTGDLVRHRGDGALEFRGRIDSQVKVRGYRIELGEIEARLGEHPAVLQSLVLAREDVPGDRRLVAYIRQRPDDETAPDETSDAPDSVTGWSELFDDIYRQDAVDVDPTFNIIGWNSTYTNEPLPRHEMDEWLRDTIERIQGLAPRRVLEIGCGTGMILFRIAPGAEHYTGADVSAKALAYVASQLQRPGGVAGIDPSCVRLVHGSADALGGVPSGSFDTAIVNSVAQYFPSADYLASVVERLVELVRPGGTVFLGDLRSLPLLEAFHTSLELFQADPEMPLDRLRDKIRSRRLHENELAIDPAFFTVLRQRLPRIGRIEIHPKRGEAHNELTGFRYQAVLRIGEPAEPQETSWVDWQQEGLTLTSLRRLLVQSGPELLALRNVPNARTAVDAAAVRLLRETPEGIATVADLRRQAEEAAAGAVDPQDLWELVAELPYEIELGWAGQGASGSFEAVLQRVARTDRTDWTPLRAFLPEPETPRVELRALTNNPLQGRFARLLAPELRNFLRDRLPEYMVPSAFVLLDTFPITPNGKVDRRKLPAPDAARPEAGPSLVAPRTSTEETLLTIWKDLLGTQRIGIDDDFFVLGGHSLLATQAVSRIREAFGLELPLRVIFQAPTVAAVAREVEALRGSDGEEVPAIIPVPRDGRLPLSFAQERLWFLQRLQARSLAYNESAAFRMEGPLDVAAFRGSLDEILRRHESLRTTFPEVDGQAVQAIHPPAPFEISSVDLRALPMARREKEARTLALAQALRPFDLARGPLVRGLLVRLGEHDHAVLFSFHHIVFDGWSSGIFIRELSTLYAAKLAGLPSPLPPLAVQYADFAAWQRSWLTGEVLERQIAWWRETLAGVPVLELPTDRPRPALPQAVAGQRSIVLAPAVTEALRDLSRARGTTLFMTLLAAFQALLHRSTGQDDLAVGTPVANRNRGEVEPMIGFFINMLVLRTRLGGDPGFAELLDRVRQIALGAYAHQDVPFEKLVEELRPARSLRHTPLFQVSFQLLNVPTSALDLPGLALAPFPFAVRSTKFDMNLNWSDQGGQLSALLDYDTDLFDGPTMDRLLIHLSRLLEGAAADPETRLSELPLLTPAEQHQLAAEWNDTGTAFPTDVCLHELFEAQVRRTPEAVALVFEGEELRYADLDARADQLAHRLRSQGVGPGALVGVSLERSFELVISLLGILKAGGAYVPLDPSYPQERLAFMVEDSGVGVLLGGGKDFKDTKDSKVSRDAAPLPSLESLKSFHPDTLAYVIYTSGSTGRPKGAMNSHRAVVNRLLWQQSIAPLTADDRVLQKTPFSFDVSVWEFFLPLVTGARLVLARPGGHQDPAYLARLIAAEGITTAHFVPSLLQVFLETQDIAACPSLRRVVCSGEALPAPLARRFLSAYPPGTAPELLNLYGPTEAAVDVTGWRSEARFDQTTPLATVPIGRPAANTVTYVLDPHLRPVPIGIPGELYLGGVQLARGYHARPDLTADRFVPSPFGDGERLYRTGDQVRQLAGGEIVYLGRLDHQVKIRGVRIELGEIEAALSALAGVRQAVAIVRDDRLVAYVVGEAVEEDLRRQLRERLPEAMVPSAFVRLDALPLLPNGKVDRKALPAPDRGPAPGFVAPRTLEENLLAEIWAELLGLDQVGALDNFFEHGGHSLMAVLLTVRIEQRFGKTLPLAALFAVPTLETMAALLAKVGDPEPVQHRPPLVAIKPQGDRPPFFCVHPVGGNVLCYLDLARHLAPDQPFYALQSTGEESSIEQMATRYLEELRRIQPHGPYRLGGWSIGGLIAYEMARQLAREGETPELVALIDTLPPSARPVESLSEDEIRVAFARDLARLLGNEISPEDLQSPQIAPLFAIYANNLRASRIYRPTEPYPGHLTLWFAEQTLAKVSSDLHVAWRSLAQGGVATSTLPGDHDSLLRSPQVERLAREIADRL